MFLCSAFLLGASKEIIWMGFSRRLVAANERLFGCQVEKGSKKPWYCKEKSTQLSYLWFVGVGIFFTQSLLLLAAGAGGALPSIRLCSDVSSRRNRRSRKAAWCFLKRRSSKTCWVEKERGCCASTLQGVAFGSFCVLKSLQKAPLGGSW